MTVGEIKNLIMTQTNNDVEDLGEFLPYLMDYINEGYDKVVYAWDEKHIDTDEEIYTPLHNDSDIPCVPEWTHKAIADWASWLIFRNGNQARQNKGYPFRMAAEEVCAKIMNEGGRNGRVRNFFNIPW